MKPKLVFKRTEPCISTKEISKLIKVKHRSIMRLISKHQTNFERFGVVRFQIALPPKGGKGGMPSKSAFLNEAQAIFLLTLSRNTPKAVELKCKLVSDFETMQQYLQKRNELSNDPEWLEARNASIIKRKIFTDNLKGGFIQYCVENGSQNAHRYYKSITGCINESLFDFPSNIELGCIRDYLDKDQLYKIDYLEETCIRQLEAYMGQDMDYHDIYQLLKRDIAKMANYLEKTTIDFPFPDSIIATG